MPDETHQIIQDIDADTVILQKDWEQQIVLLVDVNGEEGTDLLGLLKCCRGRCRIGQRLGGGGEDTVLGSHLVHRVGQVGTGPGDTVDGVFFRHRVGKHLLRKVGDQCGRRRLVGDATLHGPNQGNDSDTYVLILGAVVLEHRI